MDPFARLIAASLGFAFLAGLVLILLGRLGRKLNDHPHCRRCRYDLVGRDPLPARCPECGAELLPKRITRGLRARRPALLWSGRILLVSTIAVLGWFGYLAATGTAWIKHAPTAALAWVIKSSTDSTRNDAIAAELTTRWTAASKPPAPADLDALRLVVAATLNARDNPKLIWTSAWASLLQRAIPQPSQSVPNLLTPELIDQYLDHGVEVTLDVRRRVGRTKPIRITAVNKPYRATDIDVIARTTGLRAALISEPSPRVLHEKTFSDGGGMQISSTKHGSLSFDVPSLPPGKHRVKLECEFTTSMSGRTRPGRVTSEIDLEVLESEFAITLIADPALDPSKSIRWFTIRPRRTGDGWQPEVAVRFESPLIATLAVDLLLRRRQPDGTTEDLKISSHKYDKGDSGIYRQMLSLTIPTLSRRETLVLRPNPALLENPSDSDEMWGKEIVFENVELDWSDAIADGHKVPPDAPN